LFASSSALCNRIGILNAGSLVGLGTSQHLKSRYGRGFHIDVRCSVDRAAEVRTFLNHEFPGSKELEYFEGHTRIQTNPNTCSATLAQIFTKIEANKDRLEIVDYSVGQTSLESIFIQMAKQGDDSVGLAADSAAAV
jgi:ABC-type multidrug transport system ATPase subunit